MALGKRAIFGICAAMVVANEECQDNLAVQGSALLQAQKSAPAKVAVHRHGATLQDRVSERILAAARQQLNESSLEVVQASIEASVDAKSKGEPLADVHLRTEDLVFSKILGIPGKQVRDPWVSEELAALLASYGITMPLMIDSTDENCQSAFEHNPEGGVPEGCSRFDVSPFAVQACEDKHVGDKCVLDFGETGTGDEGWWRNKITSICLDPDHDGTAVCMPYENAWCFNSWDYKPTHWHPDGYYCTVEGGSSGPYSKVYTLGTCQDNPNYKEGCVWAHCGLKDCVGKIEYHDEEH